MEEQTNTTSRAWLLQAIKDNCAGGQELIASSNAIGRSKRYKWLLNRLDERLEVEIIQGYHQRRRAEANERTWENKQSRLERLEERIADRQKAGIHGDDSYSRRLDQEAAKMRVSIENHELQQQGRGTNARAER